MAKAHSSNVPVNLIDPVQVSQTLGHVNQLKRKVNIHFFSKQKCGTHQAHPINFWMFPSIFKDVSVLHPW